MQYFQAVVRWVLEHPTACWLAVSAVLNTLLRIRPAGAWVSLLCARWRAVAVVVGFLRSCGVDPAGLIEFLATLAAARAASGAAVALGREESPPTMRGQQLPPPEGGQQ